MLKYQIVTLCCVNSSYIYETTVNERGRKTNVFNK